MVQKCDNCWVKNAQVCLFGDCLAEMTSEKLYSVLSLCSVAKPIHIVKQIGKGYV